MDKPEQLKLLGLRIREIRLAKGLTQTELANIMGKDHPSINRLEKGKINPGYIFLLELAEGLDTDITDFFDYQKN